MKILLDMNLSPGWVEVIEQGGWSAIHWSAIGDKHASDEKIMEWARTNNYVVFTHDLDFGMLLANTRAKGPSVIQVRTQDILPEALGRRMLQIMRRYESELDKGALVTVDETKARTRILPFS